MSRVYSLILMMLALQCEFVSDISAGEFNRDECPRGVTYWIEWQARASTPGPNSTPLQIYKNNRYMIFALNGTTLNSCRMNYADWDGCCGKSGGFCISEYGDHTNPPELCKQYLGLHLAKPDQRVLIPSDLWLQEEQQYYLQFSANILRPGENLFIIDADLSRPTGFSPPNVVIQRDTFTLKGPKGLSKSLWDYTWRWIDGGKFVQSIQFRIGFADYFPALATILDEMLRKVQKASEELIALTKQLGQLVDLNSKLKQIQQDLDSLLEKSFEEMTVEDFERVLNALDSPEWNRYLTDTIKDLKNNLRDLKQSIQTELETLRKDADKQVAQVTAQSESTGFEPENNANYQDLQSDEQIPAIENPTKPIDDPAALENHPYIQEARKTAKELIAVIRLSVC